VITIDLNSFDKATDLLADAGKMGVGENTYAVN
jgi:hypothetical protein